MKKNIKNAIEGYQCSGCISGSDIECFNGNETGGIGCGRHHAGTMIVGIGSLFLGMPKGFNRLGENVDLKPNIYKTFESSDWHYNKWNVPVWKHLSKDNHTFVRGISPRTNIPFMHVFLENCIDQIECLEISEADINEMD